MNKRIAAVLLAAMLGTGIFPVTAFAAAGEAGSSPDTGVIVRELPAEQTAGTAAGTTDGEDSANGSAESSGTTAPAGTTRNADGSVTQSGNTERAYSFITSRAGNFYLFCEISINAGRAAKAACRLHRRGCSAECRRHAAPHSEGRKRSMEGRKRFVTGDGCAIELSHIVAVDTDEDGRRIAFLDTGLWLEIPEEMFRRIMALIWNE